MKVELIAYSRLNHRPFVSPLVIVEEAASTCYGSVPSDEYNITKRCVESGHMSVLEHISFTFHISEVSRALLAQLTRHRHASYTVRSQRYCNETNFDCVLPPSVAGAYNQENWYRNAMNQCAKAYSDLTELGGIANEDARMVLPNACHTELYVTMNARALIEAGYERLCSRAQWEIRELFKRMQVEVNTVCPEVAEWMVPKCEKYADHPFCTEKKSCGRHPKLSEVYKR